MTITILLLLFLLGLITGFYSGLVGTGGNIILIPALDILLTYYQIEGNELVKFVIAHSLFITMFRAFYKLQAVQNWQFPLSRSAPNWNSWYVDCLCSFRAYTINHMVR